MAVDHQGGADGTRHPLDALRSALATLHHRAGKPSLRKIAKATRRSDQPISHTTVGVVLNCEHPTTWQNVESVVVAMKGDTAEFKRLWDAVESLPAAARAAKPRLTNEMEAEVYFDAQSWGVYLDDDGVSHAVLSGKSPATTSPELAPVDDFLRRLPPGFRAGLRTRVGSHVATSVEHFWAILLVDRILHANQPNDRRWLLHHTFQNLKRSTDRTALAGVQEVWNWLFRTYLHSDGPCHQDGLLECFLQEEIDVARDNPNRLYRMVEFLLQLADGDRHAIGLTIGALADFERSLGDAGKPLVLEKIRVLSARGATRIAESGIPRAFAPDVVQVSGGRFCQYVFEVMKYPLTAADMAVLNPQIRPDPADLARPYVFAASEHDNFDELVSQVRAVVQLSNRSSIDDRRWDVPTAAEWLTMAGCVDQPYPWGHDKPDPNRANLSYPQAEVRLKPVGIYHAGRSACGAYDCCGGVHEMVKVGPNDQPAHLRLAGASYRSRPSHAACNVLRPLRPSEVRARANLGLRLVRYRRRDATLRTEALQAFNHWYESTRT